MIPRTYAEQFVDWLVDEGYTTCFFLAGGNIMHLLNAARTRFRCVPVVNEVAAGIAAEYFNELRPEASGKAFAMVTAGPGVTNILTAMAGAYLESRELLVVAGQVKSSDLSTPGLRQRGIQEVDGCSLAAPVSVAVLQIRTPVGRSEVVGAVRRGSRDRKGPVFIEFCLDAQAAAPVQTDAVGSNDDSPGNREPESPFLPQASSAVIEQVGQRIRRSTRPLVLLGGGVSRPAAQRIMSALHRLGIPIATTWNALDRIDYEDPLNFGRPDTWGMRWSNLLIQQSDLVIAVGARLSMQQTGFNWQQFAPRADVIHVDVDRSELDKPHPRKWLCVEADGEDFLARLSAYMTDDLEAARDFTEWLAFGRRVQTLVPLDDPANTTSPGFMSPYLFADQLSDSLEPEDILIPCSSGGASTVLMQSFRQKHGQRVMNNKALASMGYGLSGAIGAALANPDRRVVLVEGDGGFAQNLQELGTVSAQGLNLKIFVFENNGYASIRMTQRNYFGGAYVGCDAETGLGFPDWLSLAAAYGIPAMRLNASEGLSASAREFLHSPGPAMLLVPLDPEQTYYPKITSRVTETGAMESNPLHRMTPDLPTEIEHEVLAFLREEHS